MSEFTINDNTLAEVIYEIDEREIYNDIRSSTGALTSSTMGDWQVWTRHAYIGPGRTSTMHFAAPHAYPTDWQIESHSARSSVSPYGPYYAYSIALLDTGVDRNKHVVITNSGSDMAFFTVVVKYRYSPGELIVYDEETGLLLTTRAFDVDSILKYGRRVLNLTWTEGADETAMQAITGHMLLKYKEPVARFFCMLKGFNDTLRTQILTREISDRITVDYTNLGFNDDCFIDSITISDDVAGMPICKWGLTAMRDYEKLSVFTLDTSELDGPDILGF